MEYEPITTQRVLSPTQISLADFTINPYRGCEFNCLYCYTLTSTAAHRQTSGNNLQVKVNAPEILKKELRYQRPKRVLLGATTECFPSSEPQYRVTEQILEILNDQDIPYTILTKSALIASYAPLIAHNPTNKIFFTFNFSSEKKMRLFEKQSSPLAQRREAVASILSAGVNLRIHVGPYFPFVCDLKKILALLPDGVSEIDVELYHAKQGNFPAICAVIKEHLGPGLAGELELLYSDRARYQAYVSSFRNELIRTAKREKKRFYFIAPESNSFYNASTCYETPVV